MLEDRYYILDQRLDRGWSADVVLLVVNVVAVCPARNASTIIALSDLCLVCVERRGIAATGLVCNC